MNAAANAVLLVLCVTVCGCTSESSNQRASTTDSAPTTVDSSPRSTPPNEPVTIVADSNASGAQLEVRLGHAVLHLPATAYKTLSDSLPGFAPFPVSSYDSAVWASEVDRDSSAVAPSIVLGDFDGDKRADVAMVGVSRDTAVEIILLSKTTDAGGSNLLPINPRRAGVSSAKADVLLRRISADVMANQFQVSKDAVEVVDIGKGSEIFYWDNGRLKQIQSSD